MFDTDSVISENLSDLDDRFFTYRSTSKNDINRLKKENKSLKARIDDLEIKLNDLSSKIKTEEE
jgi:cell division protein FtsB